MTKRWIAAVLALSVVAAGGVLLIRGFAQPPAPEQPVAFDHWQHVTKEDGPQLTCADCHTYADRSSHATIPNTETCMLCHQAIKTESPEVQKLAAFSERGEQPPWVRVYWLEPSANVFFTHKPHIQASIECAICHGPVSAMRRMRREVNQTMGWCIQCHQERRVSVDCYICHR